MPTAPSPTILETTRIEIHFHIPVVTLTTSRNKYPDYQAVPEAEVGQGEGRDRDEDIPGE